jgi:uncharacterized membrane protein YfcA
MERLIIFLVRLILGLLLGVIFGLLGLALAMFVIPPALAGNGPYLFARIVLIGVSTGMAGIVTWSIWTEQRRHAYTTLLLALFGGVGGALVSYTWADLQYSHLGALEQALITGRTTLVTAVVGANALPTFYSAHLLLPRSRPSS